MSEFSAGPDDFEDSDDLESVQDLQEKITKKSLSDNEIHKDSSCSFMLKCSCSEGNIKSGNICSNLFNIQKNPFFNNTPPAKTTDPCQNDTIHTSFRTFIVPSTSLQQTMVGFCPKVFSADVLDNSHCYIPIGLS